MGDRIGFWGLLGTWIFGAPAFYLCRFLLWLAPGTVVIANAHMQHPRETAVFRWNDGSTFVWRQRRMIFVRCTVERVGNEKEGQGDG